MKKLASQSRTKIVATLGPASSTPGVIKNLILSGMDVARLNMAHTGVLWDIGAGSGAVAIEAASLRLDAAVYAIEQYGTQAHVYTREEFAQRYAENFGEEPVVSEALSAVS